MATILQQIRGNLEREIEVQFDNETIIVWCNNANIDFGVNLNIPASSTIAITTTGLSYPLPANLKVINRLSLQSDVDMGIDREFKGPYRIYNGQIIFPTYFTETDTLNVDYYKQMTYFTSITDPIDIDDRFITIYTYYCKAMYYNERKAVTGTSIRDIRMAMLSAQSIMNMYNTIKRQVIQEYSFRNEPTTILERW
jgi:hypothetical protein